jgi:hypothetical protein
MEKAKILLKKVFQCPAKCYFTRYWSIEQSQI